MDYPEEYDEYEYTAPQYEVGRPEELDASKPGASKLYLPPDQVKQVQREREKEVEKYLKSINSHAYDRDERQTNSELNSHIHQS